MRKTVSITGIIILSLVLGGIVIMKISPGFGGRIKGERLNKVKQSPNFKDGRFQNPVPTDLQTDEFSFWKMMREFPRTDQGRIPAQPISVEPVASNAFGNSKSGIRICWLGHSTALMEIDGVLILTDPVFSERTSPFSFGGTKRFDYSFHYDVENLPQPDIIIISHDHYDHLDRKSVLKYRNTNVHFVMPLGVGAHFERWGFPSSQITELDWWEKFNWSKQLTITATPARHFTGRGMFDRYQTLWASWAIKSENNSIFFSGDSGYFPGFKEIGKQLGPFDICLMECGQYNQMWPFIHMSPEESVQAHIDLGGKILLPIHWGKFKLSLHPWIEPIERALIAANKNNCVVTTPRIGEQVIVGEYLPQEHWWTEQTK